MFFTCMMMGIISALIGFIMTAVFSMCTLTNCMSLSKMNWSYPILMLIGIVALVVGIGTARYGFKGQNYQEDYEANVVSIPDDVRDFHADQQALPRDRKLYEYDRKTLHQMSAGSLHDPEIATMKASQAQDYFTKRRRIQKRIKRDRSNYHNDPGDLSEDRDAVKGDIRDAHRDARHSHVRAYHYYLVPWAEKQLKH